MQVYMQNFIAEISQLISDLESKLFSLEKNTSSKSLISDILKILHTIKGASGMFSLKNIEILSHNIETVFVELKAGKIKFSKVFIDITFFYIDFINNTLNKSKSDEELDIESENMLFEMSKFVTINKEIFTEKSAGDENKFKSVLIIFRPDNDFEGRGVILENVLEEIEKSGETLVFQKFSGAEQMSDEGKFYIYWEIILYTNLSIAEINELFLFVKYETEVFKLSEENLIEDNDFIDKLNLEIQEADIENISFVKTLIELNSEKDEEKTSNQDKNKQINKILDGVDLKAYKADMIKVSAKKLDELMGSISELITIKETIHIIAENQKNHILEEMSEKLESVSRKIQGNALEMRLIPIESIMGQFQKLIRDLSKELKKEIIFETDGIETELDKAIIDSIIEPMLHVFRNSADHGIESAEERIKKGKNPEGRIKLFAFHSGNNVIIQIHDDGRGIDPDFLSRKAIEKGLIENSDNLTKQEKIDLIFLAGFTTSKELSSVSGRGVGMDIVRQKIQDLRGEIDIDSEIDLGTYVTIKLPLTLSIVDTLQIKINDNNYLIPKYVVNNVSEKTVKELSKIKNSAIMLEDELLPIIDLKRYFGDKYKNNEFVNIITIKYKDKNYGLTADKIQGEYQAVVKPLGELFKDKDTFSGASILGDGTLALMIDTNKLIKKYK